MEKGIARLTELEVNRDGGGSARTVAQAELGTRNEAWNPNVPDTGGLAMGVLRLIFIIAGWLFALRR